MKAAGSYQRLDHFRLPRGFRGRPALVVQLWWLVQGSLFAWSPQFMYAWRNFLLRCFGAHIGRQVLIRPSARLTYPWKVSIGDYSWIGDDVVLYSLGDIYIGTHTVVSQRSYICAGTHDYTSPTFDIQALPVRIGDQAWVATDVFVGPGVTIGDGCVIGTRSTVMQDLPPGKICYGTPARPVKDRPAADT
jgi:putative colanic acid biosynthesis acetyltransferase WcaF